MAINQPRTKSARLFGGAALAAGALLAANAETLSAVDTAPYNGISVRNVFDLHDPPEPEPPPTNSVPLLKVFLTGIATVQDTKRAYLVMQAPGAPGKPATPDRYFTLAEGQRQEMLEVLEIDPKARRVKINNSGVISTIAFETNRPASSGTLDMAITAKPQFGAASTGAMAGGIRHQMAGAGIRHDAARPQMDPAQQVVLMELQREASKSQTAAGQLPPLPPTPLSEIMQQEQQQPQTDGSPVQPQPNFPGQHNTIK